jgi:hypothetical protein
VVGVANDAAWEEFGVVGNDTLGGGGSMAMVDGDFLWGRFLDCTYISYPT